MPSAPTYQLGPGLDSQPWTAARCHRLLRQLQSRLSSLRKLAVKDQSLLPRQAKRPCPSGGDLPPASKRVRLTYGRRRQDPVSRAQNRDAVTPPRSTRTLGTMVLGVSSPICGPVDLSTPGWRKISELPDTPSRPELIPLLDAPSTSSEISTDVACALRSLFKTISEDWYRGYEAILSWLGGFLLSTMPEHRDPHQSSLLGLCLRKIPACIADIEAYERRAAHERGCRSMWDAPSASIDLYEQLEALGSPGSGWRPMKLAVRSHAVALLSEAISDGLFGPEYVRLLVRLCLRLDCRAEAGKLAASGELALFTPHSLAGNLRDSSQFLPLREMLQSFNGTMTSAAPLQWLASLFKRGLLSATYLSTQDFSAVLKASLASIASSASGASVAAFLSTCLPLLAMVCPERPTSQRGDTEQTLINVVAGVVAAATAMAVSSSTSKEEKRRRAWRRVLFLLDHCFSEVRHQRRLRRQYGHDNGIFIFALARHFTVAGSPFADLALQNQAASELMDVAREAEDRATVQRYNCQATTLVCWLAQYRSKSCAVSMRESVMELCSKLDGLDLRDCSSPSFRTDVAFVLAQKTKDLRDLAFAESLRGFGGGTEISSVFSGWRWEEGISEWVLPPHGGHVTADRVAMEKLPLGNTARSGAVSLRRDSHTEAVQVARKARAQRKQLDSPDLTMCHRKGGKKAVAEGSWPATSTSKLARIRRRAVPWRRPLPEEDDWDDLI